LENGKTLSDAEGSILRGLRKYSLALKGLLHAQFKLKRRN